MKTLREHLDDLDRMVDGRAEIDKIRSQIAFIGREVSALEANYVRVLDDIAKLRSAKGEVDKEFADMKMDFERKISDMKARDKKELAEWFQQKSKQQAEFRKSHTLD